jgi:hypothetical protein
METEFFGTGRTYQITATHFPPGGEIFNERRDVQRFVFLDERDYRKKKVELSELENIESVYCVETETTTILMKGEKQ